MNPLSASSLNTERARTDAGRPNAMAPEALAGGGFAQMLQGAREIPAPAPVPASAAPAVPSRPEEARAPQHAAETPNSDARSRTDAKDDDETESATPGTDAPRETGPTLAHWLLNGGAQVADATPPLPVPPPQQPGPPTDDLKAAAMARQVLDAVRQRAKSATVGKPDATGPATPPVGADAAPRRELSRAEPGSIDLPAGATAADAPPEQGKAPSGDHRFADALSQATQSAAPMAAPAPVEGAMGGAVAAPVERSIDTPVQDPGFGHAVGVSVSRLAREGVHEARLQLNPAELGPVSVHIEMQGQEARLSLGAAHAETRALLDASLPALTEAFRADGLVLAASQVSDMGREQGHFAGQAGQGQGQRDGWAQAREGADGRGGQRRGERGRSSEIQITVPGVTARPGSGALGGLDLYA